MKKLFNTSLTIFIASCMTFGIINSAGAVEREDDKETVETAAPQSAVGACVFTQRVDNPHISSSGGPRAVQAHGWWTKGNCRAIIATISVQLQKRINGRWVDVGKRGKGKYRAGGGRGQRATARYTCRGVALNKFRAWVDVDVHGVFDLPGKGWSRTVNVKCG